MGGTGSGKADPVPSSNSALFSETIGSIISTVQVSYFLALFSNPYFLFSFFLGGSFWSLRRFLEPSFAFVPLVRQRLTPFLSGFFGSYMRKNKYLSIS